MSSHEGISVQVKFLKDDHLRLRVLCAKLNAFNAEVLARALLLLEEKLDADSAKKDLGTPQIG